MECVIQVLKAILLAIMIVLAYNMTIYCIKVKEARIKKIDDIEKSVKFLTKYYAKSASENSKKGELLSVKDAKIRDFFVRTNYIGRLTEKKIIQDFKDDLDVPFEEFKNYILNYNTEKLAEYYDIYKKHEANQFILNIYNDKNKETK